jgi:hypothetical protein
VSAIGYHAGAMALGSCRDCSREVSSAAPVCPHCGARFPADAAWSGTGIDWRSQRTWLGYPLIHVAFGHDARGRRRVARGIVAVGQYAVGLVTVAQFGVGVAFGFGQFVCGATALGQFAIAALFGVGQFATGYVAVGQVAAGWYVLAQLGVGEFLWSPQHRDPTAVAFFQSLAEAARDRLGLGH